MTALSANDLETLRARLAAMRAELISGTRADREAAASSAWENVLDGPHDRGDESVADVNTDLRLTEAARHAARLREVNEALARIEADTYGECIECGMTIPLARLQADPAVRRCVTCQGRIESRPAGKDVTPSL